MFNFCAPDNPENPKKKTTGSLEAALKTRLASKGLMLGLAMERDVVKIYLVGKLNSTTSSLFKDLLKAFLSSQHKSFVFDLSSLQTVDGAGLATLGWAKDLTHKKGGSASLHNPNQTLFGKLRANNFHYTIESENLGTGWSAN